MGDWGNGQNDRALRHCIVQLYFSISSQVTKPGMNLSNFIPGPQAPVLSLSSDIPEGTFHSYFLLLLQCHSVKSSLRLQAELDAPSPASSGPLVISQSPASPYTPVAAPHRACISAPSRHWVHSQYTQSGFLKWPDMGKGPLGCLPLLVVPSAGRASPASGGGAASASRWKGQTAPARD